MGHLGGGQHLGQGRFKLQHQAACALQRGAQGGSIQHKAAVGSGHDHDAVLPCRFHRDGGHAGGGFGVSLHATVVNAVGVEPGAQRPAVAVIAHAAKQGHLGALARAGHGLVAALAAGHQVQGVGQHGFSGTGCVMHLQHQVHVQAADDGDAGTGSVIIESASLNLKYPFGLSLSKPCAALRQAQRERFK